MSPIDVLRGLCRSWYGRPDMANIRNDIIICGMLGGSVAIAAGVAGHVFGTLSFVASSTWIACGVSLLAGAATGIPMLFAIPLIIGVGVALTMPAPAIVFI